MPKPDDLPEIDNDNCDDCLKGIEKLDGEFGGEGACELAQKQEPKENQSPRIDLDPNGTFTEVCALELNNGEEIILTEITNIKPEKTEAEYREELRQLKKLRQLEELRQRREHYGNLLEQPIPCTQSTKSALDIFDETVDAITNEEIRILLIPLKAAFRDEKKSKELKLVIQDFQKLATAFRKDPNIEEDETKKIFNQTLAAYNEYDKTKLSLRVKTILSTVFGGLIGAAIGFSIGVFAGGLGCIPAMCIGAAVGCVLGAGGGMGTSLTLFGKKYDRLNGATLETTDKNKSILTKKLHLAQTLNTIQKRFF